MELQTDEEQEENNTETETEEVQEQEKSVSGSYSSSEDVLALPKVRKRAEEAGIELASIKTGERITEEDLEEFNPEQDSEDKSETSVESKKDSGTGEIKATPSVRKLARREGIDISKVEGSGRGGKITRQDILEFEEEIEESETEKQPEKTREKSQDTQYKNKETRDDHSVQEDEHVERIEMSGVKKKTAEKMSESRFTAPHVTHVEKADLTELKEMREREKEEVGPHLTYLPFIMKAVADTLQDYPKLNAELDTEKDEIVLKKYYDFNIAVDTENWLMIPKIEDVNDKSIVRLASEVSEKAEKAKNRDLSPEELENGTFSITNLGVIGAEEFTPIINYPQTAILGVGRISETAEVVEGEVQPRTTVKLSLSYDHRVVDGATGARFMNQVVENLENPEKLLLKL